MIIVQASRIISMIPHGPLPSDITQYFPNSDKEGTRSPLECYPLAEQMVFHVAGAASLPQTRARHSTGRLGLPVPPRSFLPMTSLS